MVFKTSLAEVNEIATVYNVHPHVLNKWIDLRNRRNSFSIECSLAGEIEDVGAGYNSIQEGMLSWIRQVEEGTK